MTVVFDSGESPGHRYRVEYFYLGAWRRDKTFRTRRSAERSTRSWADLAIRARVIDARVS